MNIVDYYEEKLMSKKVDILGIKVDNLTLSEALERVEDIISYGKPERN